VGCLDYSFHIHTCKIAVTFNALPDCLEIGHINFIVWYEFDKYPKCKER